MLVATVLAVFAVVGITEPSGVRAPRHATIAECADLCTCMTPQFCESDTTTTPGDDEFSFAEDGDGSVNSNEARPRQRRQVPARSIAQDDRIIKLQLLSAPVDDVEEAAMIAEVQDRFVATKRAVLHEVKDLPQFFANRVFSRLAGKPTKLSAMEMFYYNPHCGTSMLYRYGPTDSNAKPYEALISESLSELSNRHFPHHFATKQVGSNWFWTTEADHIDLMTASQLGMFALSANPRYTTDDQKKYMREVFKNVSCKRPSPTKVVSSDLTERLFLGIY